jgi:formylmethanofuran dehydrogenase subunit E
MSAPYDEPMFECDCCGEYFIREEMVGGEHYCKDCFKELSKEE